jgi:hypothetical protein
VENKQNAFAQQQKAVYFLVSSQRVVQAFQLLF